MLQTINELKPDVVCLQEYGNIDNGTKYVSVRGELDSLGYHYYVCSNDKITHRKNNSVYSEGVAIFSKTPIFGTGRVTISTRGKEERLAFADIKLNNKTVRFFTAHLVSFYLYSDTAKSTGSGKGIYRLTYQRKRSIQYKIRETEVDHQQQVAVIREVINKSPYPVIFCGDLNTTATSYNYHTLKDGLQDAFLQKGSGLGTTFYKIVPTLRIDVCFVDKELQVLQCKVEKKELSDHYPVITDVKWK
jgi:endonuclease/exonuclease/phosphatase family metal-dependent hydrolase